jgi:hypothetical protein
VTKYSDGVTFATAKMLVELGIDAQGKIAAFFSAGAR